MTNRTDNHTGSNTNTNQYRPAQSQNADSKKTAAYAAAGITTAHNTTTAEREYTALKTRDNVAEYN